MVTGFGLGYALSLLLTFLIKFFFITFMVGLVGGLIVSAKNYLFTPEDLATLKAPFKGNKEAEHHLQSSN